VTFEERYASLSDKQANALHLLLKGYSNSEIARRSGVRRKTISFHLGDVYRKMGAGSVRELMGMYIKYLVLTHVDKGE